MNPKTTSALVAVLLLIFACGSNPSGSTTIKEGNWSGFFMDSIPVAFSVSGSNMENVSLTVLYDFASHPDSSVSWVFNTGITDNTFQYYESNGSTPYAFSIDFQGTFTPPDKVTGTISTAAVYDSTGSSASDSLFGTWTASPE